jgi:hypothetical protein
VQDTDKGCQLCLLSASAQGIAPTLLKVFALLEKSHTYKRSHQDTALVAPLPLLGADQTQISQVEPSYEKDMLDNFEGAEEMAIRSARARTACICSDPPSD